MADRACPFCRFPVKPGADAVFCPECGAMHHAECWEDNRGCAIMGCAAAPGAAPEPPPPPPAFPPPPPPPSQQQPRSNLGLVAAIVALALAVTGVAVALIVSRPSEDPPAAQAADHASAPTAAPTESPEAEPTETSEPEPTDTPEPEPTETATPEPEVGSTETREEQIANVLQAYYDNVMAGDYDAAWRLLSPTYRRWKLAAGGGYQKWISQEEVHSERLDPSGMHVEILRIDGPVATINVTGMHYRSATSPRCTFHGVTWFRRSGGQWRYDQGYLQSAARRAEWRPKREQTLGFTCESDAY